MEFDLLKKAISKNIENLQDAIQTQQAYTTTLCGHINLIYSMLVQLDRQVQTHFLYPYPQSPQLDVVQLNAPDYDPDIDEQPNAVPDTQPPNGKNVKDDTMPDTINSGQQSSSALHPDRPEMQPPPVLDDTDHPEYQNSEKLRAEHPSDYRP